MPEKNLFIPDKFGIVNAQTGRAEVPRVVSTSPNLELFVLPDHQFGLPIVRVTLLVHLPRTVMRLARPSIVLALFRSALLFYLTELLYMARLAGIGANVKVVSAGVGVVIAGYSDKLGVFAKTLGAKLAEFCRLTAPVSDFLRAKFETIRQEGIKTLDKALHKSPVKQFRRVHAFVTVPGKFSLRSRIDQLEAISLEEYLQTHESLLRRVYTEALVSGNVVAADAERLINAFQEPFRRRGLFGDLPIAEINDQPELKLRRRRVVVFRQPLSNRDEPNSLLAVQFQLPQNESLELVNLLLGAYLKNPFFNDLRSEQQVGYAVQAFGGFWKHTASQFFVVQSGSHSLADLSRRVRGFIEKHRAQIAAMTRAEFESLRKGALAGFKQEFTSIAKKHSFYFSRIERHSYDFDYRRRAIETLSALTKSDLVGHFERVFFEEQRVLEIHLRGASERATQSQPAEAVWKLGGSELPVEIFEDAKKLQAEHELNPDPARKVAAFPF